MAENIFIIIFIVVLFLKFHFTDRLIKYQYEMHYDQWKADGKPRGYLWRSKENPSCTGHLARSSREVSWLIFTPKWIKADRFANLMLWLNRVAMMLLIVTSFCLVMT